MLSFPHDCEAHTMKVRYTLAQCRGVTCDICECIVCHAPLQIGGQQLRNLGHIAGLHVVPIRIGLVPQSQHLHGLRQGGASRESGKPNLLAISHKTNSSDNLQHKSKINKHEWPAAMHTSKSFLGLMERWKY